METPNAQGGANTEGADFGSTAQEMAEMLAKLRAEFAALEQMAVSAKNSLAEITASQSQATAALAEAQQTLAEVREAATSALATKTQITNEQTVIAAKSAHIENAKTHADTVRAELDRTLTAATKSATDAEGAHASAKSTADAATSIFSALTVSKAQAEADLGAIDEASKVAKASAAATKTLADKAATIESSLTGYEQELLALRTQSSDLLKEITDLLPGATSAGLAHAFDERRQSFLRPSTRWQWLFVGSVAALVVLALSGLIKISGSATSLSYDNLFQLWLARLPIAAALIWLALHASRESALAKRLEEDYGYKATIAASFQGFQRQMTEIGAAQQANSPLGKLCNDTLATLASPPGRIYEKHKLTVSPATEIASAAKTVGEAVGGLAGGKKSAS